MEGDALLVDDSIRGAQRSHRKPDVALLITDRIEADRQRSLNTEKRPLPALEHPEGTSDEVKEANMEDSLPLAPAAAARLGLTSILPPMQVKENPRFQRFIMEVMNPDLRYQYPTWTELARHFGVSVQTIKTWMLSAEVSKALEVGLSHEARMMMPSVLRSVKLRAELTGDPHAAEFVRKVAKLGTAETDASRSFEKTLRQIAAERAGAGTRVLEVKEEPEEAILVDPDPLAS